MIRYFFTVGDLHPLLLAGFSGAPLLNPGKAIPSLARCAEYGKMHVRRGLLPFADIPRF